MKLSIFPGLLSLFITALLMIAGCAGGPESQRAFAGEQQQHDEEVKRKQEEEARRRQAELTKREEERKLKETLELKRKQEEERKLKEALELKRKQEEERKLKEALELKRKQEEEEKKLKESLELKRKQEEQERKLKEALELKRKQEEEARKISVLIDNANIKVTKKGQKNSFVIKRKPKETIFLNNDGGTVAVADIEKLDPAEIDNISGILLPSNNWYAQAIINNPLGNLNSQINLTRPNFWGYQFKVVAQENDGLLLVRVGPMKSTADKILAPNEFEQIFGKKESLKLLGKGAGGSVYEVVLNNAAYALKENAYEANDLEELQFTRGVAKTYGSFEMGKIKYLLMEKGKNSLDQVKNPLSKEVILNTLERFKILALAQKQLHITNKDIKPQNMLLTDDGIKVIDISLFHTKGYDAGDTIAQQLAIPLLDNLLNRHFLRGTLPLSDYFAYDRNVRSYAVASLDYLRPWFYGICQEQKFADCKDIKDFNDLFAKFNWQHLASFGEELQKKEPPRGTEVWITDLGNIKIPFLTEPNSIDWVYYFDRKAAIGAQLCSDIDYKREGYLELKTKYQDSCIEKTNYDFEFTRSFNGAFDPDFRDFIMDFFMPVIKENTFKVLAIFHYDKKKVLETIINSIPDEDLKRAFHELINVH